VAGGADVPASPHDAKGTAESISNRVSSTALIPLLIFTPLSIDSNIGYSLALPSVNTVAYGDSVSIYSELIELSLTDNTYLPDAVG
jgi:hypothetical protein